MSKYTTIAGDTWDYIAYTQLGSCDYVHHLMDANREYIGTAVFSAGVTLTLPEITAMETAASNLPPWRRST